MIKANKEIPPLQEYPTVNTFGDISHQIKVNQFL